MFDVSIHSLVVVVRLILYFIFQQIILYFCMLGIQLHLQWHEFSLSNANLNLVEVITLMMTLFNRSSSLLYIYFSNQQ